MADVWFCEDHGPIQPMSPPVLRKGEWCCTTPIKVGQTCGKVLQREDRKVVAVVSRSALRLLVDGAGAISEERPCPCGAIQPAHACDVKDQARAELRQALR